MANITNLNKKHLIYIKKALNSLKTKDRDLKLDKVLELIDQDLKEIHQRQAIIDIACDIAYCDSRYAICDKK